MLSGTYKRMTSEEKDAAPGIDRYTSVVDRYTPGVVTYSSRSAAADRVSPAEMEISNCCRSFLLSRLRAAEVMNKQLSDEANSTNRLLTVHPPGEFNVDLAIEQLRAHLVCLLEGDINVIRQLLTVNEQIEEVKWQRKYGEGSPCTPSVHMSGSCTADIDSVDLDAYYMEFLASTKHPLLQSSAFGDDILYPGLRLGYSELDPDCGRIYTDDVTDDVFQNDDSVRPSVSAKPNNTCVSNEIRFTVKQSEIKPDSPPGVRSSDLDLKVQGARTADANKTSKVEFHVGSSKPTVNAKVSPRGDGKVRCSPVEVRGKHETSKVEFKVENAKGAASSQYEIRFVVPNNRKNQGTPDTHCHSRRTTGALCQTESTLSPPNAKSSQELDSTKLHCNQHNVSDQTLPEGSIVSHL